MATESTTNEAGEAASGSCDCSVEWDSAEWYAEWDEDGDAGETTGSCDECGVDIYEEDGSLCDHCEWAAMGGCYDIGYDADDSEWLAEYESR